jgi:hypothetical protein
VDIWQHARDISPKLVKALARVDARPLASTGALPIEESISRAWECVIEDAKLTKVSLDIEYISSLHNQLAAPVAGDAPGVFQEGRPPLDWTTFANEVFAGNGGAIPGAEAWLLAQLVWGNHFQSMQFSLAWLCINGLRLQNAVYALYPPSQDHSRFMDALQAAGPDTWDAETLRALFGCYEREQAPMD